VKLKEIMFAWNPNSDEVKVGPWPDKKNWSKGYTMTGGACYSKVAKFTKEQCKFYLYLEGMHLIIRDKVNPIAVHNAFYEIDEYRDGLAHDMPKPFKI